MLVLTNQSGDGEVHKPDSQSQDRRVRCSDQEACSPQHMVRVHRVHVKKRRKNMTVKQTHKKRVHQQETKRNETK